MKYLAAHHHHRTFGFRRYLFLIYFLLKALSFTQPLRPFAPGNCLLCTVIAAIWRVCECLRSEINIYHVKQLKNFFIYLLYTYIHIFA